MTLAQILKLLREQNGLTQRQIAEKLGLDRSTYSYYELGKTKPDTEALIQLAKLFRVTTDYLLDYERRGRVYTLCAPEMVYQSKSVRGKHLTDLTREEQDLIMYYRLMDDRSELVELAREMYNSQFLHKDDSPQDGGEAGPRQKD